MSEAEDRVIEPVVEPVVDPVVDEPADETLPYERYDCTTDDPELLATAVDAARAVIERGECIVMPTDTVYGIGADAFSADAVQRLLDAKIRGRDMPPPVLIAESSLIRALATDVPDQAKDLIARHWPGPLTIICKRQPSLRIDLGDAEDTVALRVPDHDLAREVLRSTGPMAVSSANISGAPATLDVDDAISQLHDRVALYLDGGPLDSGGAPSTIVDFTQSPDGEVLRHGALRVSVLRETCPGIVDLVEDDDEDDDEEVGETLDEGDGEAGADLTASEEHDHDPVEVVAELDAGDVKAEILAAEGDGPEATPPPDPAEPKH